MARFRRKKQKISWFTRLTVPVFALLFFSYFGYHTIHGDLGLTAQADLENELVLARARLDVVQGQKNDLTHRVSLLTKGSVEKDTLNRYARQMLNHVRGDELVVFRSAAKRY